jgi:hypothetical protein
MVIIFTLQAAYSGATYVAGPFDISGTTSSGVTTLLGNNISKAELLTGVTISDIDDATTGGTIQSVDGICSNSISWLANGAPANNTYTFQAYCTQDAQMHPIGSAPTFVIFTESELGFVPVQGVDYVRIAGSPNVDYVFEFNGETGEAETSHTFIERLGIGDFNCDGGAI